MSSEVNCLQDHWNHDSWCLDGIFLDRDTAGIESKGMNLL